MIDVVGINPFLGESHYGLPWKPCVLNLARTDLSLGQLYLAFMVS